MKRVVLDHCVPRPFRTLLTGCSVSTSMEMGWAQLKNGELLAAAEVAGFEVLITADKNLRYQQKVTGRQIALIELPTNRLRLVVAYAPQVNATLQSIQPGEYCVISP